MRLDPTGYFFPGYPKVPTDLYLNDFKPQGVFSLESKISGTGVRNDFATSDTTRRAADVQHVKEVDRMRPPRMGCAGDPCFQAGPMPTGSTWDDVSKWMADELRTCAEHGKKYGVLVGVQNHGDTLKTADERPQDRQEGRFRLVWASIVDTGYFQSPDPYEDIARVLPYAVNWQIKEKTDGVKGNSRTDLKKLVGILKAGGYRGYLPIETLSIAGESYDPRARVTQMLGELREAIGQTE